MKRSISLVLAFVMLLCLAGCNKKDGASSRDIPTLLWYINSDTQTDINMIIEAANKIVEPAIGAKINIQMIDDSAYSERLRMYMATGQKFDLCFTGYVNDYLSAVRNGGLAEMDDLIQEYAPQLFDTIPDYALKAAKVNGKIYALPNVQIMASDEGLFVFEDIAKKYGMDKISRVNKMEELEPYFDKIKADNANIYPVNGTNMTDIMANYQKINEYAMVNKSDPSHKILYTFDIPEYEKGLMRAKKWYEKGYVRPDIDTANNIKEDAKNGKYAGLFSAYKPGIYEDHLQEYGRRTHFIETCDSYMSINQVLAAMTGISKTSENKEKAMQFINLINTNKELYNLISFGIEGKHYQKVDDGKHIKLNDNSGYFINNWKIGSINNSYLLEGQPDNMAKETRKMNDECEKPVFLGFNVNTDMIKNELAQCAAVSAQYRKPLLYGTVDYKTVLPEYKKRLKDAGVEKILSEIQGQLDKWWAENKK